VVKSPLAVKNQKSLLEQKLKEADEKTAVAKDMLTSKRDISKKLETLGEELESRTCLLKKIIAESKEIRLASLCQMRVLHLVMSLRNICVRSANTL